jgi:hypothetical protein
LSTSRPGWPPAPPVSLRSPDHDLDLHPDRALDQLAQGRRVGREGPGVGGLDQVEDRRVGDEAALHDLGEAGDEVLPREAAQQVEVADHAGRFVEGADEVLPRGRVDAGLATHRGVHHRQQGGGHVHHPHPAQPGRGDEAAQVGGGPAPDGDHGVGAGEAGRAERLPAGRGDLRGLGPLAVRHRQDRHVVRRAERGEHRLGERGEALRVHDGDPLHPRAEHLADRAGQPVPDHDVVRRRAGHREHRRVVHRSPSSISRATSSGSRPSVSTVRVATAS